ncbi:hypothetical protein, partial [Klebsiella aerogenes]
MNQMLYNCYLFICDCIHIFFRNTGFRDLRQYMSNEKVNYGEVGITTGFYMALNEGERVDMARSSPQEVRIGSPGKRSATGEMAEYLSAKHKNKRLGLPTEPFIYIDMIAFPGGGARRLSRATGCYAVCSPGKRSATGEMAARLAAKHKNKRPGLPTEPFVYVGMTAAFPGGGARRLSRATGCYAVCSPGKR